MANAAFYRAPAPARFMAMQAPKSEPAPVFVTQRRTVRDFIADQHRIATIKSDWLYRLCGDEGRRKLLSGVQTGYAVV